MFTRRSLGLVAVVVAAGVTLGAGFAQAADPIVVYSALDTAKPAIKAFTAKTGTEVKLVSLSTGELLGKIAAEGAKPQFDLVWLEGSAVMRRLAGDGILKDMAATAKAAPYTAVGKKLLPDDAKFLPVSVTGTAIAINTKKLPDAKVEGWADLATFAGKVAAKDPNFSGPAFQWLAGLFQTNGEEKAKALLAKVLTDKALAGIPSGGKVNKALITGDASAAIQQDSSIYGLIAAGEPMKVVYPKDGTIALPSCIGLSATSTNGAAAETLVKFLLSTEGQAAMQTGDDTDTFFSPLIEGVKAKGSRPADIAWVYLDDKAAAAKETEWKKWYRDQFVP